MQDYTKDESFDSKGLEKDTRIIYCTLVKGINILGTYYENQVLIFLDVNNQYEVEVIKSIARKVRESKKTVAN